MQTKTEMILVPEGTFKRGSDHSPDEQPILNVEVSSFWIDRIPVTNKDYLAFIHAGGYEDPFYWTPAGWEYVQASGLLQPNYWTDHDWNAGGVPVTGVSWWEALAYARFAGKTLPTEAQWEYAARGTDARTYPWGEELPTLTHANFAPDCEPEDRRPTRPEAHSKNVSPFGCVDIAGNFAEWCLDNYWPNYNYEGSQSKDPGYSLRLWSISKLLLVEICPWNLEELL